MDNPMELLAKLMENKDAANTVKNMLSSPENEQVKEIPDMAFLTKMLSENKQGVEMLGKIKGIYDV